MLLPSWAFQRLAIVFIGVLVLAPSAFGSIGGLIEDARRPGQETRARELVTEVTGRTADSFDDGRWTDAPCTVFTTRLTAAPRSHRSEENLRANNATIRDDALYFEAAGWDVTRYIAEAPHDSTGFAFRAENDDEALIFQEYGGLGYAYMDSSCPESTSNLTWNRTAVARFPTPNTG